MNKILSKTIVELEKKVKSGDIRAVDYLWKDIEKNGYPLFESIESSNENMLVTLLYKEEQTVENIVIHGSGVGIDCMENKMIKLCDTNIWYKTFQMPSDSEFTYWMSINDGLDNDYGKRQGNLTIDKLNPNKFVMKDDEEAPAGYDYTSSYIKMPLVKSKYWKYQQNTMPKGGLEKFIFNSKILDNKRRIWVYKPFGYEIDLNLQNQGYNLLLMLDGNHYVNWLSAQNILDNLIGNNKIHPTIAVFVSSINTRLKEYTFNDDFNQFITEEVLPYIYDNYNITNNPTNIAIGGFSLGGLTSAYIALKHPDKFGNVISQSGSFHWKQESEQQPQWLIKQYESSIKLPIKFYLTYGIFENAPKAGPTLKESNEELIRILKDKKYNVESFEFKSGHDYLNWDETLAMGLISVFGK